ncbi:hypothetical protein EJ06DRAFT_556038 [Trichodelitschia bisporula]|uniref:RING-type domain-containing protein n=1 Tax=Trichodelitschia bisporula TaxID=703511 RepID=A0A6G1I0G7_9PEZI|nr:hypothetical protein EJ06DRAFT_556038 [Trichodelitschia bisporula]
MSDDYTFRCNTLTCRVELKDQAVVTTCSHIFCLACAESSGLSRPVGGTRTCPACESSLPHKDDAAITHLNPSEDYKTSVLSGFSPTMIMECAARGIAFYSYQASQEIHYQSFFASKVTEKCKNLSSNLDSVIADANAQIRALQESLKATQDKNTELESKNFELQDAFRQKSKAMGELHKHYRALKNERAIHNQEAAASEDAEHVVNSVRPNPFGARLEARDVFSGHTPRRSDSPAFGVNHHRTRLSVLSQNTATRDYLPVGAVSQSGVNAFTRHNLTNTVPGSRIGLGTQTPVGARFPRLGDPINRTTSRTGRQAGRPGIPGGMPIR